MALMASALVRLPILSVLWLASLKFKNSSRSAGLKQFEFLRFASPRTLCKMVKKDSFGSHKRLGFPWITEHYADKHYKRFLPTNLVKTKNSISKNVLGKAKRDLDDRL
jgi:hypothetical protein